jgi:hypothetical protein
MSPREDSSLEGGVASGSSSSDPISRLVGELTPVNPVRFERLLFITWLVQATTALVAVSWLGSRPDLAARATESGFIAYTLALALGAALSAAAAIRGGIPGREVTFAYTLVLLALPLLLAGAVVALAPTRGAGWETWVGSVAGGWPCMMMTAVVALLPWASALYLLNQLYALREARSALLGALAASCLGALVTHLRCAVADPHHVAAAHYLPVLALAAVGCVLAVLDSRLRGSSAR